jgi:putative transposase
MRLRAAPSPTFSENTASILPLSEIRTCRGRRSFELIGNAWWRQIFSPSRSARSGDWVTHYVLFFIDIVNRAAKIAGITPHPDSRWMTQIARNLTDLNDGFLRGKRYLILDRDTKYSDAFRSVLVREGIQVVRLPARSPNLNAFAERFVRSIKEECLSRMIFFGPASLQHAVRRFTAHYHTERNHQGLENQLPQPASVAALPHHPVQRRQRLGGLLSYYHRVAA